MIARLTNASKSFQVGTEVVTAVARVNLAVDAGEFACIYGASGSGKTTLLNVLAGLDTLDAGEVVIGKVALSGASEGRRADIRLHNIGVVFQTNNLLPEFTAQENVALPLMVRGYTREKAEHAAAEALKSVGLADFGARLPGRMSGGQRQRVGIARALAGEQALLVADEPTGALDSHNSSQLFGLMRSLCDERRTAVVLATHDPLARDFADSVYLMVDGMVTPQ